ncbi:MAG: hypothetical protein JXJ20_10365 [Anaerolineae bacterium]|jgi:glycosyltransferase involved in cell wall biosynthesis|nr:hypothetical protein [Anaerolineae bacterium]
MKTSFIVWLGYHRRSELLAEHLGASLHFVRWGRSGSVIQAPFRYVVQTWKTWRILRQERPDVVVVQNPPIFCALAVYLYTRWYGGGFAIDSHTGAFTSRKWRWSRWLHRALSRRALATIVHNTGQEQIVKRWECPYCVMGFTPGDYSFAEPFPLDGQFNVAVVCAFMSDEPLNVVFEAARQTPDVDFYFSGDSSRLPAHLLARKPDNCHLTGYLPYAQYIGLLRDADVVMDLTDANHTLLMGGFEAVSLGTPLITSDWPVLRDYFSLGTVHVPNTVQGIREGVDRARHEQADLKRDIVRLREQLIAEWEQELAALEALLRKQEAT